MWKCTKCKTRVGDDFDSCWNCQSVKYVGQTETHIPLQKPEELKDLTEMIYSSSNEVILRMINVDYEQYIEKDLNLAKQELERRGVLLFSNTPSNSQIEHFNPESPNINNLPSNTTAFTNAQLPHNEKQPLYCEDCGAKFQDNVVGCSACKPQETAINRRTEIVSDKIKNTSKDAWQAIKIFAADPVGGLPKAFGNLDEARAIGVGIFFTVIFSVCIFIGTYMILPAMIRPSGFGSFFNILVFGGVPFISIAGSSMLARIVLGGNGSIGGDSFIAGSSLLPLGFFVLLSGLLGIGNLEIIAFLGVFTLCYTILILYTGSTSISKISQSRSAIAVSLMIIVSGWLIKVLFMALLTPYMTMPPSYNPFPY